MKEEKNKTGKPLSDFQRYVRGEMTKRQENAFQRKLQRDPFAAEAADGYSEISAGEAGVDLEQLGKRLDRRVRGRRRIIYYRIAASIAVLMIISSVYLFLDRNKPADEISKDAVAPSKMEAGDNKKSPEPDKQVTGILSESQEATIEKEKDYQVGIPIPAEPVAQETLAFAEKKDTLITAATGNIAMTEKDDSAVIVAADQAAEAPAQVSDANLAEYRAETKNAMAAGADASKAAVREAVNTPPLPVTGKTNYDNYLKEQIRRPQILAAADSAIVIISFTVRNNGTIDDFKVLSSPGEVFSNEAKRLVTEGPAWNPAITNGEKTDEEVRLNIIFK